MLELCASAIKKANDSATVSGNGLRTTLVSNQLPDLDMSDEQEA